VRHSHLHGRTIILGRVSVLRVCDRLGAGDDRIRFTSAILPPSASTIALLKGGLG
jgi:hypothetical protein